jgi:xanthosine utilization system XapX-like protein
VITVIPLATRALAKTGDGADAVVRAVRATPRIVWDSLSGRRERWVFGVASGLILLGYLMAIGDLALSVSGRWSHAPAARFAPDGLFSMRAPWLFEPVLELHPGAHFAVLASPINLLLGMTVAALAGLNLALAAHGARRAVACRRPGYSRSLAVLPAFLLGVACCVPTFVLALGAGTAAAVLPVLLPLRPWIFPLTLVLLLGTLVWGARQVQSARSVVTEAARSSSSSTDH